MTEHHRTSDWRKTVLAMRPIFKAQVDAGNARCIDCGRPIRPGDRWQVGHIVSAAIGKAQGLTMQQINDPSNLGPSHTKSAGQVACNQVAGGKLGAAIVNDRKHATNRMPSW